MEDGLNRGSGIVRDPLDELEHRRRKEGIRIDNRTNVFQFKGGLFFLIFFYGKCKAPRRSWTKWNRKKLANDQLLFELLRHFVGEELIKS